MARRSSGVRTRLISPRRVVDRGGRAVRAAFGLAPVTVAGSSLHAAPIIPADPRAVLSGPLDPDLLAIRAALLPHRRRLWLRRIVRRAWAAVAIAVVAELALWSLARLVPIETAATIGAAIPLLVLAGLIGVSIRVRPGLGEAAVAVDHEAGLGDRAATALALAVAFPKLAGPDAEPGAGAPLAESAGAAAEPGEAALAASPATPGEGDAEAESRRFVRRQRRDTLAALRLVRPGLFRPRLSRNPAAIAVIAMLVLAPVVLLPNPQDAAIAQARQVREEAKAQAEVLERLAEQLEKQGASTDDPRTRLAKELRDLARQLRERPDQLDANLAKLGSIEATLRSQLDPANEQRAAALSALSRGLSRSATGNPEANRDGDPKQAAEDLKQLATELPDKTEAEKKELARQLAELEGVANQAGGAASQALTDAAQSLAQGDTAGAQSALERLAEALADAVDRVATNRDLSAT
ncbi:MAG TPA: hypothetical protein VEX41_07615, partial [Candidatus Eisenbacteria bacterium]|nr:hypothetical protein [Candidatus Eisenbacteria bacterium]